MEFKRNDIVGRWRLDKQLGSGGQASVWRARYLDEEHSPAAALKVCSSKTAKAKARFARELDLLRAQNHPGIVRVRDAGDHLGHLFFVMELATTTLAHISIAESAGTRLILESRELLLRLLRQACSAVAHLHDQGVLHRDIKPSNVLLMLDPPEPVRAVVADLGIAANEIEQGQLTAAQEIVGTPAFRAPESLVGQHSARSDVYSLGKTIEALFNRGVPVELGPGKCLRDKRLTDELWDALDGALAGACAFDPALRFENASALLRALPEPVLGLDPQRGQQVQTRPPTKLSLTVAERVALSEIISACPSDEDRVSLAEVRQRTRLNEYHFAISVRRLGSLQFLDSVLADDEYGNRYSVVRPTSAGVRWAEEHHEEMVAAIAEVVPKVSKDNDIPF